MSQSTRSSESPGVRPVVLPRGRGKTATLAADGEMVGPVERVGPRTDPGPFKP